MDMKIGAKLAQLRKKQGLTQEQLADQLGVSAPAVSKWETDTSYPDITLLCPLARALGTNLDTLLQFEETLSDEQAVQGMNQVLKTALQGGYAAGEAQLLEWLRQYPNSLCLKFYAATAWSAFPMFFPNEDSATKKRWAEKKKQLLQAVQQDRSSDHWQNATLQLAQLATEEGSLAQGERLLKELPEHMVDSTAAWALLHIKKGSPEEALKIVQKRLYLCARQTLSCLGLMLNPKLTPDAEHALQICQAYRDVDQLFGLGGMYDGLFLEIYLKLNRYAEAAQALLHYAQRVTGHAVTPVQALFSPGIKIQEEHSATTKSLRELLLKQIQSLFKQHPPLAADPQCQAAIEILKESLK